MVEPTESETLEELDRFIDAMIAIRAGDSPDRKRRLAGRTTTRSSTRPTPPKVLMKPPSGRAPYARDIRVPSTAGRKQAQVAVKYWPPIGRVDNVYGDRNLFCSCVPVSEDA
jgi:glycine dehydrogenase